MPATSSGEIDGLMVAFVAGAHLALGQNLWCQQLPVLPDKPGQLLFVPPLPQDRPRGRGPLQAPRSACHTAGSRSAPLGDEPPCHLRTASNQPHHTGQRLSALTARASGRRGIRR